MIDHIWSVICGRAIVDNRTNTVSLIDVLEQINVQPPLSDKEPFSTPVLLPIPFEVVTFWARSDLAQAAKGLFRVSLQSPWGKTIQNNQVTPVNLVDFESFRSVTLVQGFPLVGQGRYIFQIELQKDGETRWRKVAQIPLKVVFISEPSSPQPPTPAKAAKKKSSKNSRR